MIVSEEDGDLPRLHVLVERGQSSVGKLRWRAVEEAHDQRSLSERLHVSLLLFGRLFRLRTRGSSRGGRSSRRIWRTGAFHGLHHFPSPRAAIFQPIYYCRLLCKVCCLVGFGGVLTRSRVFVHGRRFRLRRLGVHHVHALLRPALGCASRRLRVAGVRAGLRLVDDHRLAGESGALEGLGVAGQALILDDALHQLVVRQARDQRRRRGVRGVVAGRVRQPAVQKVQAQNVEDLQLAGELEARAAAEFHVDVQAAQESRQELHHVVHLHPRVGIISAPVLSR
mmetsp:Transcript_5667/g.22272  ORF Transcript_5667/g.22272 Transcript_5667/m.22272 type:complete len:282 (+) Transcript_5667:547-1392(+)|eukprot:scaffold2888_cov274-Pinguiococcus_pyrenoidosus.AAC.3